MPRSFSIKLHSETQIFGRLGMSGGRSPRHAQNPLSGERRKTLSITHHALSPPSSHQHLIHDHKGGGPRVVVSTAAFHARVRGSVPGVGGLKETKMFLPHPRVKVSIVGSLRDREVACSASDHQGSNFESCHLNHLTILRRFSWPSLAYMCTKVA